MEALWCTGRTKGVGHIGGENAGGLQTTHAHANGHSYSSDAYKYTGACSGHAARGGSCEVNCHTPPVNMKITNSIQNIPIIYLV